jgi:hypothetical protein
MDKHGLRLERTPVELAFHFETMQIQTHLISASGLVSIFGQVVEVTEERRILPNE